MRPRDMFLYAFNALRQRSIRTWLTVLGITVGITAIVVLVGLVQGLQDYFTSEFSKFGSTNIIIVPVNLNGGGSGIGSQYTATSGKLFMKDYERLERIPEIEHMSPVISARSPVSYKDEDLTASISGIHPDAFAQISEGSLDLESGRLLADNDKASVVIGHNIAYGLFDEDVGISSGLVIEGKRYRVVGILQETGSSFVNFDDLIIMPFDEAKLIAPETRKEDEISAIRIKVAEGSDVSAVADEIEGELRAAHRVGEDEEDFGVITPEFIMDSLDQVTGILGLFLGGVASISLLVGGVGIANTMFMSVTERRREIGILKAVGGREAEIQDLFLFESGMISLAGGLGGLILAFLLAFVIASLSGIQVVISLEVVSGAILFSAAIGIIFGVFPARQAARLDPVEALVG